MTAGEHSCTRRALLGAAVGVAGASAVEEACPHPPVLRTGPSLSLKGRGVEEDWEEALAGLARAEAELGVVERGISGLPFAAAEAVQGAYDARCDAWEEALRRVMGVPAPDLLALAAKVVLVVDADVGAFNEGEACLAALRADAVRLVLRE